MPKSMQTTLPTGSSIPENPGRHATGWRIIRQGFPGRSSISSRNEQKRQNHDKALYLLQFGFSRSGDYMNWIPGIGPLREILRQPIEGVEGKSAAMPAAILSDRLYLGWRGNEPAILTMKIGKGEDGFSTLGSMSVPESCCYLSISPEHRFLLAAGGWRKRPRDRP